MNSEESIFENFLGPSWKSIHTTIKEIVIVCFVSNGKSIIHKKLEFVIEIINSFIKEA